MSSAGEAAPVTETKPITKWDGDRRFMFPAGKELHEPGQRRSSFGTALASSPPKAASPKPATSVSSIGSTVADAIAGRRRSSASSGSFGGLMKNRSSHDERRQGWEDMKTPGSFGGFLSGFVNKPSKKK